MSSQTLGIVEGCYVEFDGRDITVVYAIPGAQMDGITGHSLRLTLDFVAAIGTRVDAKFGPYNIAARIQDDDGTAMIGIEIQRPGKKPLRFYLERDAFELCLAELQSDDSDVRDPQDGADNAATQ